MLLLLLAALTRPAWSGPLQDCSDQFIGSDIKNAPTLYDSSPTKPFANNVHLCYQDDDASFFAIEYWPEQFAPRWVAYKLDPDNYGANGCNSFTRAVNNCYIKAPTWQEALACDNNKYRSDPFHRDYMLKDPRLSASAFTSTGHDRGHIAPRSALPN